MQQQSTIWLWSAGAFVAVLAAETLVFSFVSPAFGLFALACICAAVGLRDIAARKFDWPMLAVAAAFLVSAPLYAYGIAPL